MKRRNQKVKLGRSPSDIPVVSLEQFKDEMASHVAQTIETVVNGKIRAIDTKLTDYIKKDEDWKSEVKPSIDNMKNLTGSGKFIVQVSIGITAIIGVVLAIRRLLNL